MKWRGWPVPGSVATAADVPGHEVTETTAAINGVGFVSATGAPIPNEGQIVLPKVTREGSLRRMTMQAAPVAKPLASVQKICDAGHLVIFDNEGSYIFNKHPGVINQLREESGSYMLDLWIPPATPLDTIAKMTGRKCIGETLFGRQPK